MLSKQGNICFYACFKSGAVVCTIILLLLVSLPGCVGRQQPDPESQAKYAIEEIDEEFKSRENELRDVLNRGELTQEDVDKLDTEYRLRLEEFVKEHKGTAAATEVIFDFIQLDLSLGEFASAEARIDEIIGMFDKGNYLAVALIQKSILAADRDLESALEYIIRAENTEGLEPGTKFEAQVQHLKLLEWLRRDDEFEALYIMLSEKGSGRYISQVALWRLHYLFRHGQYDAAQGLIDSVKGMVSEEMFSLLSSEYAADQLVGKLAPQLAGTTVAATELDISSYNGNVVVIIFFTTPNPHVRRHLARLNSLYEEFSGAGLEIAGVCLDVTEDGILPFISSNGIEWPVIYDTDSTHQIAYRVYRDPKFYIIDRDGILVSQGLEGVLLEEKIREMFEQEPGD